MIPSAAAIAAALLFSGAVLAHGGETFFVAEPAMVAPGAGVGVRGDLPTSGPVYLSLAGTDGTVWQVGVVEETDGGHFEILIAIPADVPAGHWTLLAQVDGTAMATTPIEVAGTAIDAALGGQGQRDEDDGLLVPLPSGWQAAPSRSTAATTSAPADSNAGTLSIDPSLALLLGGVAAAMAVWLIRSRNASRTVPPKA